MRMPGPDQPLEVFEDMLAVTRDVAASLGADLKDEQLSVMTSQTISALPRAHRRLFAQADVAAGLKPASRVP